MFEVVYLAYSLDTQTVIDEVFYRGTKRECKAWLEAHCNRCYELNLDGRSYTEEYWLGSKHLAIYPAE